MVKRGEVWLCALDPTVGGEIRKTRPCLIVSPDELNSRLTTVIAAPLTSGSRPTRFRIPTHFNGKDGLILPDQMRTLDHRRLLKRLGQIAPSTLNATLAVIHDLFAE